MDYWITMAVNAAVFVVLIAALSMLAWDRRRLMRENDRLKRWLDRAQEIRDKAVEHSDEMEKRAAAWQERAKKALIEADRARKECAMHEKERRQLEAKILHLKEEYEAQAARADELMQREMANFLGYNGTERGQKELNDDAEG